MGVGCGSKRKEKHSGATTAAMKGFYYEADPFLVKQGRPDNFRAVGRSIRSFPTKGNLKRFLVSACLLEGPRVAIPLLVLQDSV